MTDKNSDGFSAIDVTKCPDCDSINNPCRKHLQRVVDELGVNPGKVKNEINPEDVPRKPHRYVWTDHATSRRGQREVGKQSCEKILAEGSCSPAAGKNMFKFEGENNNKRITVVVEVTAKQLNNKKHTRLLRFINRISKILIISQIYFKYSSRLSICSFFVALS